MKRRKYLLEQMNQLKEQDITCSSCEGFCCTYRANSIQITPLEAADMLAYLGELTPELTKRLEDNIQEFRLDKEVYISRGKTLRRTYTCPFFKHESLGCAIAPEYKPYGCLGFNALEKNVSEFGKCGSNEEVLQKTDELQSSENQQYKQKYSISWDKKPIPMALIELSNHLKSL